MPWVAICSIAPVVAAAVALLPMAARVRGLVTLASAAMCMSAAAALVAGGGLPLRGLAGDVDVDALSAVLVLTVALVYLCSSLYAIGYLHDEGGGGGTHLDDRHFHVLFNLFAATMFWVPLWGNLMLLWVAIEVTTVTSALLVGLTRSTAAAEAAWKYILVASTGLVLGLLGLILLYFAAAGPLGTHFNPTYATFLSAAPRMANDPTRLGFALVVIGFGTKAGLVPMHTWLPDAHSEGPTPVSAMLSGALLASAMYAILRVYPIVTAAVGTGYPHVLLYVFGTASLVVAGLSALRQRNLKRLYAYSSIEHMGILSIGVAVGGPIALYGVMLHVVAHGASKSLAFFGAGGVLQRFGRDMRQVRGLSTLMPATAFFVIAGGLAVSALPPGALFRSELMVLAGAFRNGAFAAAAVLLLFVTLVFLGVLRLLTRMTFTPPAPDAVRGEASRTMLAAMALAAIPAFALGVVIPGPLDRVLGAAAGIVGGGA